MCIYLIIQFPHVPCICIKTNLYINSLNVLTKAVGPEPAAESEEEEDDLQERLQALRS